MGYVNDLKYDGLKLDAVNRLNGKKGVALVYRSYCNSMKIKSPKYSSFEHALWKLSCKGIHFTVLGIYHPPYSSINNITDNQFLDDFLDLLGNTMANYSNVVVLGDLNIHLNKTDEPVVQVFSQSLEMLGLQQIVTEFTHKDGNLIDIAIIEDIHNNTECYVEEFVSDHRFVRVLLKYEKRAKVLNKMEFRNLKDISGNVLKEKIQELSIPSETDINISDICDGFEHNLKSIIDDLAPIKLKLVNKRIPKPWFDTQIDQNRKDYRRCQSQWMKKKNDNNWSNVKKTRNKYVCSLKQAKKNFYSNKVLECKGNSKALYNTINGLISRTKTNMLPEDKDNQELADHFSEYFHTKIEKIADALKVKPNSHPKKRNVPKLFEFKHVSKLDVIQAMKKLGSKQCELDVFPVKVIHDNKEIFAEYFVHIVNKSLTTGTFPDTWKCTMIRPLMKKINAGTVDSNYRPVSNLNYFSKILECLALKHLVDHCESNKLLPNNQSAYRKGFSCETMLLKLADEILNGMEEKSISALVALDLSAAFDTCNHEILLETFHSFQCFNEYIAKLHISVL